MCPRNCYNELHVKFPVLVFFISSVKTNNDDLFLNTSKICELSKALNNSSMETCK